MQMDSIYRFLSLKCIRLRRIWNRYHHPYVDLTIYEDCLKGKKGIEIGGPSMLFCESLPVYDVVDEIDCINHSSETIWFNRRADPFARSYAHKYVCDAIDLSMIADESYDFLLSCHSLEHMANPLKALGEWMRILKHGAYLLIVVPDKRCTFDHLRPVTSFSHILNDFERNTGEDDMSHLPEVVRLHDAKLDMLSRDLGSDWSDNFQTRRIHHHVFDRDLLRQMADYSGLETMRTDWINPYHIVMLAEKS